MRIAPTHPEIPMRFKSSSRLTLRDKLSRLTFV
jgi:hypothetical protein